MVYRYDRKTQIKCNRGKKMDKKEKKQKNKGDIGRIATKVMAAVLAELMILAVGGTLVYYLKNM